jgi:hypothetical protein
MPYERKGKGYLIYGMASAVTLKRSVISYWKWY